MDLLISTIVYPYILLLCIKKEQKANANADNGKEEKK